VKLKATVTRWLSVFGPGLISGASDDDPSGISTYSVAGATTGFSMLWVIGLTTPMMAVIQGMCARLGMVTGYGLATHMRKRLPRWLLIPLALSVIIANTINAGADLEGMAASTTMVLGVPDAVWVVAYGLGIALFEVFGSYRSIVSVVKWLTLTLFAYVITAIIVHPNWLLVLRRLVLPEIHMNATWLTTLMGVLGTTITPYLFFLQSDLEVEEKKAHGLTTVASRRGATQQEIDDAHLDVNVGMIFSNAISFFIIVTTAATLFAHGMTSIQTAQDAARALEPLAGHFAYLFFALGMVTTGLLAIPVLIGSSAYVVAETLGWRYGLDQPLPRAHGFYGALIAGAIVAVGIGLLRIDPIRALFWSAVINGVVAVPLLVVVVRFASDHHIMGRWKSSPVARAWGWFTVAAMGAAALSIFIFWGKS
jgi:NRAMP (natural resistance-associated macrophage protein)-like metal ion transporter